MTRRREIRAWNQRPSFVYSGASLGAAGAYLVLALWQMRAVLRSPSITAPFSTAYLDIGARFGFHDLKMVVSQIAYNARTLLTEPTTLFAGPQCYPVERALTFGEPMIAEGLLGLVPYALFADPLVTMAGVLTLKPVIAALAGYALVLRWTRSPAAAFVAGLLLGFHPVRLIDPAHIFIASHEWTAVALLAVDAIFAGGGWAWVLLLVLAGWMQVLESFYPLLGFTFLVGIFGAWKLWVNRRSLPAILPKLIVAGIGIGLGAAIVLGPYLITRETWPVLGDRAIFVLYPLQKYLFGNYLFLGITFWGLALLGFVDLLRLRRPWAEDPRWPLLLGALALAWFGIVDLRVPWFDWDIPALYHFLRWVPGVDAVRAPGAIAYTGLVSATVFAGYGMHALVRGRSVGTVRLATAIVAGLWIAEVFVPAASTTIFGARVEAAAVPLRPTDEVLALHRRLPPGPVLNLPWARGKSGEYLLLGAYHGRRIGACYNSFEAPTAARLRAMADAVPDPSALNKLAALGFRSIVVHDDVPARPEIRHRLQSIVESRHPMPNAARFAPIGRAPAHRAFTLEPTAEISHDIDALDAPPTEPIERTGSAPASLSFVLRNPGPLVYRHPDPIEPTPLLVRWQSTTGEVIAEESVRALLPLALDVGEEGRVEFETIPPAAGAYVATLFRASEDVLVPLSAQEVRVGP